MNHKDTLQLFDELVSAGTPEPQARAQAQQLGAWNDILGRAIENFNHEIESFRKELTKINIRLENIDKDLFWMRLIGGAMTVAFLSNGIAVWCR